jgi:hypothetical protein
MDPAQMKIVFGVFKNDLVATYDGVKSELKFFLDNQLEPYLESLCTKFLFTKTFLHQFARVNFYDIYFQTTLSNQTDAKIRLENVHNLLETDRYVTIIGGAGSGKSMMAKHFFLNAYQQQYAVPIFIELRNLNQFDGDVLDYINMMLLKNNVVPSSGILSRMLKNGRFLLILDGYDEVFSSSKQKVTQNLNSFIDRYSNNKFIITSRPGANIELLPRFNNYLVNSLDTAEVKIFVDMQLKTLKATGYEELRDRVYQVIDRNNLPFKAYLKNPLLLSMFLLYFENYPEIPETRSKFYENVFEALRIRHNSLSKFGWAHERKSVLSEPDLEKIIKIFSFITFFNGEFAFEIQELKARLHAVLVQIGLQQIDCEKLVNDLEVAIPILHKDGLEFKYPHRSLQEYFAAVFLSRLDERSKTAIYNTNLKELYLKGTDNYFNFWHLCRELDCEKFTSHFLIYHINMFIHRITRKDKLEMYGQFAALAELQLELEFTATRLENENEDFYSDVEPGGILLFAGDIIASKWSTEYNFYRNLFKFLGIPGLNRLVEVDDTKLLFGFLDNETKGIIYNEVEKIEAEYSGSVDEQDLRLAEENENCELVEDLENYETSFENNDEDSEEHQENRSSGVFPINVRFEIDIIDIPSLPYYFIESGWGEELENLLETLTSKKTELQKGVAKGITFNAELLKEFIKGEA